MYVTVFGADSPPSWRLDSAASSQIALNSSIVPESGA